MIASDSSYIPSSDILRKYADVLVNFALGGGTGIKRDEVVHLRISDIAMALGLELQNSVLRAGGNPMVRIVPTGYQRDYYELASKRQLKFAPNELLTAQANLWDHTVSILAEVDPFELRDVDPQKILTQRDAFQNYNRLLTQKETAGKFTWTLALWGTQAKAGLVGLSLQDYWQQIEQACFLHEDDPVAYWRNFTKEQKKMLRKLNSLEIDYLTVKGPDCDLKITLGKDRAWQGGSGRNIPSFEFFTSPDWRGCEGWVYFNQPLYRYGKLIEGAMLTLEKGQVVKSSAKTGADLLEAILSAKNADKLGEFSLTDRRHSRITHVMADTLFDENIGGPFGNMHIAVGKSYHDCYRGDASKITDKQWEKMGYNYSNEHTDIISTTDRTVVAHLSNGKTRLLYEGGEFQL